LDDDTEVIEDLRFLGIDAKLPETESEFLVFEENWQCVMIFCQLATQWNVVAMGGYSGLNYQSVDMLLNITPNIKDKYALFKDIQTMERAALVVFNKQQEKQA